MLAHTLLEAAGTFLAQIPNPAPVAPPGADKITNVVGYVKWGAGAALVLGFFGGLVAFGGGRVFDHHRAGKVGTVMMMSSLAGAIFYAVGYTVISTFAAGG